MKILVLDNYDSFTYNLVHILVQLGYGESLDVIRNDKITLEDVASYDKILLSPGPGIPEEAGIMKDLIKQYGPTKSILGVCLGHQGIAEVYGAKLHNLSNVLHGVVSKLSIADEKEVVFDGVPDNIKVCHYHSWVVDPETLGTELEVTATNESGLIMGIRHKTHDVRGVQFHPESILTEHGNKMIENWITE